METLFSKIISMWGVYMEFLLLHFSKKILHISNRFNEL